MSDYGLNFGFRRSEPAVKEGRLSVPLTGDFRQGDLVTYDPANIGFLKHAAANSPAQGGFTGLLIQEEGWDVSAFGAPVVDTFSKGKALNGKPTTIVTGAGLKVWLKNTPAQTRWDGRAIPAVTVVDLTGVVVGDFLAWDGDSWARTVTDASGAMRVTSVGTDSIEAVLRG